MRYTYLVTACKIQAYMLVRLSHMHMPLEVLFPSRRFACAPRSLLCRQTPGRSVVHNPIRQSRPKRQHCLYSNVLIP